MMKFSQFMESISQVVYHYSNFHGATSIMKTDSFRLQPVSVSDSDEKLGNDGLYYMSVARTRSGSFWRNRNSGVVFVLDGNKLNQRYKGKPVDYFSDNSDPLSKESEDRIFSDEQYIKPASSYIKEIHAMTEEFSNERKQAQLDAEAAKFMAEATKSGIPTFFYRDQKAWLMQDKRKAVTFDIEPPVSQERAGWNLPQSTNFEMFTNLMTKKHTELTYDELQLVKDIVTDNASMSLSALRSDLRDYNRDIKASVYSNEFLKQMKKFGAKDVSQMMKKLKAKYS